MMMFRLSFVGFFLFLSTLAHAAYFEADLPTPLADPQKGTHIIIVGRGDDVRESWLQAGHTQALVFQDRPGMGKIKIIGAAENSNYWNVLNAWGYKNIQSFNRRMSAKQVISRIGMLDRIESIDFIGHNGGFFGFVLEDHNNLFYIKDAKKLGTLWQRFSSESFIRIMGCNTGFNLAPALAAATGVPVAGTFTSADTQELHDLNEWFYNDEGRYPPGNFVLKNPISYSNTTDCTNRGGCTRLKAVNLIYSGSNGVYDATLPFMKYFCGGLSEDDCFLRMAKSTTSLVSTKAVAGKPSPIDYATIVAEQFCPSWKDALRKEACRKLVIDHLLGGPVLPETFSSTNETSYKCDFNSCDFRTECNAQRLCFPRVNHVGASTSYVNELNAYKRGYALWK